MAKKNVRKSKARKSKVSVPAPRRIKSAYKMYCPECGELIGKNSQSCPKCGAELGTRLQGKRNKIIAGVLSFLVGGLGQIYNGETVKGILLIIASVFFLVTTAAARYPAEGMVSALIVLAIWLYSIYDAYKKAGD